MKKTILIAGTAALLAAGVAIGGGMNNQAQGQQGQMGQQANPSAMTQQNGSQSGCASATQNGSCASATQNGSSASATQDSSCAAASNGCCAASGSSD